MTVIRHASPTGPPGMWQTLWLPILPAVVGAAWLLVLVGQVTGNAVLLHHHPQPVGGTAPPAVALGAFLVSWLVMITATMLPASLRSVRVAARNAGVAGRRWPLAIALATFAAVWMAFGLLVFGGDAVLQRAVAVMPGLAARPWLPAAAAVALAAAYQFTPLKAHSLAACRHPARLVADRSAVGATAMRLGLEHGLACVGNAWALMLVMVVAGLGDIWWLAAMTAVMTYEATGRYGQRAAAAVGLLLAWLAVLIALPGWLPT